MLLKAQPGSSTACIEVAEKSILGVTLKNLGISIYSSGTKYEKSSLDSYCDCHEYRLNFASRQIQAWLCRTSVVFYLEAREHPATSNFVPVAPTTPGSGRCYCPGILGNDVPCQRNAVSSQYPKRSNGGAAEPARRTHGGEEKRGKCM